MNEDNVEELRDSRESAWSSCPVCCQLMPVTKAGVIRIHGPLNDRCADSGRSPTAVLPPASAILPSASVLSLENWS